MVFEFKLPDIGEGVHEGEIVSWAVKEGDAVKEDEKIVEVMTDKATVEITSPRTGTIAKILVQEGETANVGDVIVQIDTGDGGGAAAPAPEAKAEDAPAKAEDEEKTLFDLETDASSMWRSKRAKSGGAKAAAEGEAAPQGAAATGGKVLAAPAIRREAKEKGIDLSQVGGSGPAGRITREDWNQFLAAGGRAPAQAAAPATGGAAGPAGVAAPAIEAWEGDERVPLKGLRKAIHANMRQSEDYAVPFSYWDEFDVTELVKLRKESKALAEEQGVKITYLPFIVKAVVAALKKYPDMNAHVEEDSNTLVRRGQYHIGIATATDRGLMVTVVKDADKKSIFEISKEILELSEKARTGKASREELTGSTFTITSLGKTGGLGATPVINHPESAILGVHKLEPRAKVNANREVVVRDCINLSGTFDHRWIDGHIAAEFVQHVGKLLEKPQMLLLS